MSVDKNQRVICQEQLTDRVKKLKSDINYISFVSYKNKYHYLR